MDAMRFSNDTDALLTEVQAADVLSVSVRTLQAWRAQGRGPRFVRVGRLVRYAKADLLEWIKLHTVAPGTLSRDQQRRPEKIKAAGCS